jgi:DNA methylase
MNAEQLAFFKAARLPVQISRQGRRLVIPEGVRTADGTHTLHRFPGKFIPNLPRFLFRTFLKERRGIICDPFCGSGTTLIEAALDGRRYEGVDVDPLAVMIAQAKSESLSPDELERFTVFWHNHDFRKHRPDLLPQVPRLDHWFNKQASLELSSVKGRALELDGKLRRLGLILLSSIVRQVSNADDQTQKTYVSGTLTKNAPLPSIVFPIALKRAVKGLKQYSELLPSEPHGSVRVADARTLAGVGGFDDVLTSPPYIDSIDYPYNQMLEYFWLLPELGVDDYDRYRQLRRTPIGFSQTDATSWSRFITAHPDVGNVLRNVIGHIAERSGKEASNVRGFFVDMANHLEAVRARQKAGAYYICVIGNSTIRGIEVPTVELLGFLFKDSGYRPIDRLSYEIRRHYMKFPRRGNSGKINEDNVLIFQAT